MFVIAHAELPFSAGPLEWAFVGVASTIIFAILGPRIWRDFSTTDG